jgi:hypothetical protein
MDRVKRITELLQQRAAIDAELAQLKEQAKQEKAAFAAHRKSRKAKEQLDG